MTRNITKPKAKIISNCLFFLAVTVNSFIYMFYDFKSNDVQPSIEIYGRTQLVIMIITGFFLIINSNLKNKYFRALTSLMFYFSIVSLLFIQIVPAILWVLFNGQVVGEYPFDPGVTGSWVYGAYHIIIIAWGIFNIYRRSQIKQS